MAGFGLQPAGASPAGLGTPSQAPPRGGVLFRNRSSGESLHGRFIDPRTRTYVFDSYGRTVGMTAAQQGVLLAVMTDLDSCAVREIGNRLKTIKTFGASFNRELQNVFTNALARLVSNGLVEIVSVEARRVGTMGAYVHLRWRDLSTGQIHTIEKR